MFFKNHYTHNSPPSCVRSHLSTNKRLVAKEYITDGPSNINILFLQQTTTKILNPLVETSADYERLRQIRKHCPGLEHQLEKARPVPLPSLLINQL